MSSIPNLERIIIIISQAFALLACLIVQNALHPKLVCFAKKDLLGIANFHFVVGSFVLITAVSVRIPRIVKLVFQIFILIPDASLALLLAIAFPALIVHNAINA